MINTKVIISLLFFLLFTIASAAQTLSNKSKEELKTMKQEAINSEDYDLAKKVTEEIKSRKTIDEKIAEKNIALNSAITVEDYDKAEQLKNEIEQLKANKIEIKQLKEEKKTAITTEDYDRVIAIDKEIKALHRLKQHNDRPFSTEQEIDFLITYYDNELEEFDKTNGKYTIFKGEQRTQMMNSFKQGQNVFIQYKERVNELTDLEENAIHPGFLSLLKLSKNHAIITKYHQYYLSKVTKTTPYTFQEKINQQIDNSKKAMENFPKDNPKHQQVMDMYQKQIKTNQDYLARVNNLSDFDKKMINIYFDTSLISSDLPLDKESVDRYFKVR